MPLKLFRSSRPLYTSSYSQFLNLGTAPDSVVLCYLTRACQLSLSHSISAAIVVCVRRGRTYEKAAGGTGSLSGPGEARSDLDLDVQAVSLLQLVQWLCRRGSFT